MLIIDGPFKDLEGKVSEIDEERRKVKVLVNMFGPATPAQFKFLHEKKNIIGIVEKFNKLYKSNRL